MLDPQQIKNSFAGSEAGVFFEMQPVFSTDKIALSNGADHDWIKLSGAISLTVPLSGNTFKNKQLVSNHQPKMIV